jgi:hypothetical protein
MTSTGNKLYLHKDMSSFWSIKDRNDKTLYSFIAYNEENAKQLANAWCSSWSNIEVILVDREKEKRN